MRSVAKFKYTDYDKAFTDLEKITNLYKKEDIYRGHEVHLDKRYMYLKFDLEVKDK